ncbi:MAG: glycosyltransferase family 8 protein [Rickettsiales bacterium]|jgi:lipopolysaccharide biosynthesis glycosyltransferase|nr:glycosyltransferase family 8 protein [Rickettsiales bacterium]
MTNVPVFLASNDNYAPFVATTIASICYNTKSFVEFYILDNEISNFHKKQIETLKEKFDNFSIEFLQVKPDLFKDFSFGLSHISLDMYSRFFMFDMKPNLKKAIYIDLDVVVLGDIIDLYNENLDGKVLGAIHVKLPKKRKFNYLQKIMQIPEEHLYFNSGVLIFDCEKISKNFAKEMLELLAKYKNVVRFGDQDTLNKYFTGNYKTLSNKYNFTNRHIQYGFKEKDIVIRHFEGAKKPWNSSRWFRGDKMLNFKDWWYFANMTSFYSGLQADFMASKIEEDKFEKRKSWVKKTFIFLILSVTVAFFDILFIILITSFF